MMRKWTVAGVGLVWLGLLSYACVPASGAVFQEQQQQQQQQQQQKPAYTLAEYNAYQAAASEKDAQQKIKLLDDFVAKFPTSALLPYVYHEYYKTYNELKNFPKTIEYADKEVALGDKVDAGTRLEALYLRTLAFNFSFNEKDPNLRDQATKARDAALAGLKVLDELKKPDNVSEDAFKEGKKAPMALFNFTAGVASSYLKDYPAAIESFKAALVAKPDDAVSYFRMGVGYLQMNPPQQMDGFWALARSVALKGPGEAQVRVYLRNQLLRYQQTACDKLLDDEMNQLITLAGGSADRPASFTIPSAADLQKARDDTANFIPYLRAGGDNGKLMWLATCGLEYPEVVGKVISVTPNPDGTVELAIFTGATPEETEAGTTPNMDVKVVGQPEAKRIQAGDPVRFAATLVGYDQNPFMLHWDKARVNPEDIPAEKPGPSKKRPTKRPPKKPGR